MAWVWASWKEFAEQIQPVAIQQGRFRHASQATELEQLKELLEAHHTLEGANRALTHFEFGKRIHTSALDAATLHQTRNLVIEAVYAGEALLLFHKRLALTEASYGFLHSNDILDHWDRYVAIERVAYEVDRLTKDVQQLLEGYDRLLREDERFLTSNLDLPEELQSDFLLARNVFSIGLDDIGLFLAGRGLEKVLRRIAKDRKIEIIVNKKQKPADQIEFYNLIEVLSRVNWKVRQTPLIAKDVKHLLHFLRELRNRGAHKGETAASIEGAREKATVVASTANKLWNEVHGDRAKLEPLAVLKDWGG
jgi:hypothetical protein